jgi:ABC-type Zn uptake system ZnuABC Zn-binding protein ZnuA
LCHLLKVFGLSFLLIFAAVSSVSAADKMTVFVSIVPRKFFVEKIAKDLVDVQVMVEPGANPHIYEPKPAQMAAIAKMPCLGKSFRPMGCTFLRFIRSRHRRLAA